jgi:UDP-glucose:(heptosyl)LPS alpha-1,3-glucosyltransferase
LADELRVHFPGVPVRVTPNGIDLGRFAPDPARRAELRLAEGVAEGEVVVLFVGGDWHRKGLALAVEAVQRARDERLPVRLWIVGEGDRRLIEKGAARTPSDEFLRFFGRRLDTETFYAASDVLILPSAYETFSLVTYEAAATGLPIIGTAVSGVEELVREGGGGVLIEPTPESVLAALRRLAGDDGARIEAGRKGSVWARRFTWEASAEATTTLYRDLVDPTASESNESADQARPIGEL